MKTIKSDNMSLESVRLYFKQYGLENRILELKESSATVELAARALNCEKARIAKTMSFMVHDTPILIVTAGDMKIDNAKYKTRFGVKAKMVDSDQVSALIGHPVGGVCPFAVLPAVEVYLDTSLQRFESVYPAAGSPQSAICLNIAELEQYSKFKNWVTVCKPLC